MFGASFEDHLAETSATLSQAGKEDIHAAWNPILGKVVRLGDRNYAFEKTPDGTKRMTETGPDGIHIFASNYRQGWTERTAPNGEITRSTFFTGFGALNMKLRERTVRKGGSLLHSFRPGYDENGAKVRETEDSTTRSFDPVTGRLTGKIVNGKAVSNVPSRLREKRFGAVRSIHSRRGRETKDAESKQQLDQAHYRRGKSPVFSSA